MTQNKIFQCIKNNFLSSNPKLVFFTEFNLSMSNLKKEFFVGPFIALDKCLKFSSAGRLVLHTELENIDMFEKQLVWPVIHSVTRKHILKGKGASRWPLQALYPWFHCHTWCPCLYQYHYVCIYTQRSGGHRKHTHYVGINYLLGQQQPPPTQPRSSQWQFWWNIYTIIESILM